MRQSLTRPILPTPISPIGVDHRTLLRPRAKSVSGLSDRRHSETSKRNRDARRLTLGASVLDSLGAYVLKPSVTSAVEELAHWPKTDFSDFYRLVITRLNKRSAGDIRIPATF